MRSMKSLNCRPARLPWSSLARSQVLPRAALVKALPPHGQPSGIFVITFSPSTASPWTLTLAYLKNLPAGCGANTRITFLLDLFSEISALFLSDDSKSPVRLSNLLTSPRVTQKPKKDVQPHSPASDIRRRSVVKKIRAHGLQYIFSRAR